MKKNREKMIDFDRNALISELLEESKSTKIYPDAAKRIASLVADDVEKWLVKRTMVTESDYESIVYQKILKYNSDLAYIYLNRDKII